MSLHLYFFRDHTAAERDDLFPSETWTPHSAGTIFTHVELRINRTTTINRLSNVITYVTDDKQVPPHIDIVTLKLPDEMIPLILSRRTELNLIPHYRYRDFLSAANYGYCTKSLLKTGFTCATMTAYLLGFEQYYRMCPDDLWYSLLTGVNSK